jgi:2-keto-4-pentenoate hydratase/2-oxohepta-3-ene-1,7-dioic acid hydratase in catechol pathway
MPGYALATYRTGAGTATALVLDGKLYDIAEAARVSATDLGEYSRASLGGLVARWLDALPLIDALARAAGKQVTEGKLKPLPNGTALDAPIRPARVYCAAANYVEHAKEMSTALASKANSRPYFFQKPASTVIGPEETVRKPEETSKLDWEVELAVVIGKRAKNVPLARAFEYVAGYTIVNDVSARDLNKRTDYPFAFDWFQGKCWDTFCPIGPWIVPTAFIADPQNLRLKLTVNGTVQQDDSSTTMIWTVREQIAYLSTIVTLEPGDVIATGTPSGVGAGKGLFLKAGDVMEAWVEGVGTLRNPVANGNQPAWGAMK